MATPKGNAMAFQALRPLPTLKVADLANEVVGKFEAKQAALEQARLKRLADEKKSIGDFFDKFDLKGFSTISNLTDQTSKVYTDTVDYLGQLGIMAQRDPSNRYKYQALAKKAEANYNALQSTFGTEDFRKAAADKLAAYDSGDYFLDSDSKERLNLIKNGAIKMELDRSTGEYKFALPRNNNSKPDEDAKWYSAGEVQSWYTNPEKLDWMNPTNANKGNTFFKELDDTSKNLADEYSTNKDGNITVERKVFAKSRAEQWFDNKYGKYVGGEVDDRINQFAKMKFKDEIDSEEEYLRTKTAIIDYIGSQVATETKRETKFTAAQLQGQKDDNAYRRKATAELGKTEPKAPKFSISDPMTIMQINGSGRGRYIDNVTMINLNNKEGVAAYLAPDSKDKRKMVTRYAIIGKDEQGRNVIKDETSRGDVANRMQGYNLDPIALDNLVRKMTPATFNKWEKTNSKNFKAYNQAWFEREETPTGFPVVPPPTSQYNP